jgi:dTDP-4-dehydrorhamnose reductase
MLLLGASGQFGRDLLVRLGTSFDVTAPGHDRLDLGDDDALREAVRDVRPMLVVNAAAYNGVDAAESDAAHAYAINGRAPGVLAEEAERCGARLVHFGTNYVFDGRSDRPWREDDGPSPLSVYGHSKLEGERAIARTGARALVVRTAWLYGPAGRNFARTILAAARRGGPLEVVDDQHGTPTLAGDLAKTVVKLIEQDAFREGGELLHATGAGEATWFDFASAVVQAAGLACEVRPVPTERHPRPARRPVNGLLDTSRLLSGYGIALPDWRDSLLRSNPATWDAEPSP